MMQRAIWYKLTDVSGEFTAFIILIMEAVSFFETSVSLYQTARRNIAEDNHLQRVD
jgi:hypothetical protein